jgi:hypothetical protein
MGFVLDPSDARNMPPRANQEKGHGDRAMSRNVIAANSGRRMFQITRADLTVSAGRAMRVSQGNLHDF